MVGFVLFWCGGATWNFLSLPTISPHQGDGTFNNLSNSIGLLPIYGYSVTMPEFDLGEPRQAEYRFAGLTDLRRNCGVYFVIRDEGQLLKNVPRPLKSKVKMELVDGRGEVVVGVKGLLHEYIWSGPSGLEELYQDGSFFVPDATQEYRLRVIYEPDARLAGFKGFVYLRCGGRP